MTVVKGEDQWNEYRLDLALRYWASNMRSVRSDTSHLLHAPRKPIPTLCLQQRPERLAHLPLDSTP